MTSAAIVEGGVECDIHVLAQFGRAVEGVGDAVDRAASFDFSGAAERGDTTGFEVFGGGFMTVLPSFSWWRERERVSHLTLQQINHTIIFVATHHNHRPNNKVKKIVMDRW
jgi:hypothetical protein